MDNQQQSLAPQKSGLYLVGICIATTIGGFVFGYDTAVISGAIDFVTEQFKLSPDMTGWVVSSVLLGCIVGSASSGIITDRLGRKAVLILSSILLLLSAIGSMFAQDETQLIIVRLIGGLGVGITAMASPMYISEIAPANYRGRMVTLYQLAVTIGIVCSFFVNAVLLRYAQSVTEVADTYFHWIFVSEVWRAMFGAEAIPAFIYIILLALIPESPRWLIQQGRTDQARSILRNVMPQNQIEPAINDVTQAISTESDSVFELFRPELRMALIIGIALSLFSQLSGINVVMYFGPTILKEVGFDLGGAMGGAILIGVINFLFTFVAIWKVDSFGRRPLLLVGVTGAFISLAASAIFFRMDSIPNICKLIPLLTYCACFSFSYGPLCWVIIGEIFPTRYRGRAVSIATAAIWIGAFIVSQLFPRMLKSLGAAGCFGVYALITGLAIVFIYFCIHETKGQTLEQIEKGWTDSKPKSLTE